MMHKNIPRAVNFENFAAGRNGRSLLGRIHGMVRHYMHRDIEPIDPNWHSVKFQFDRDSDLRECLERPFTDKDACHVEFDYRPTSVILVGPKVGHVLLTDDVFGMVPEPLIVMMRACDVFNRWGPRPA